MSLKHTLALTAAVWVAAITSLHVRLNTRWRPWASAGAAEGREEFRIGFLPVT